MTQGGTQKAQMEEELITKKELLDHYGISYGALYRWKRKCLIPDEWFIHKATFTGQETFFPKEKIIKRVDLIMSLKDTMSLDEIAESLIPSFTKASLDTADILALGISDEGNPQQVPRRIGQFASARLHFPSRGVSDNGIRG